MEFCLKVEDFQNALNKVAKTHGSSTMPALNNIYIEADLNGECMLKASNGHEYSTAKFMAQVTTEGNALLDASILTKLVGTFDGGVIDIKMDGTIATLTHPNGEAEISGHDPLDFISLQGVTEESGFMIGDADLKEALNAVAFAINDKSNVQKLAGIAIVVQNGKTTFAATDTRRIARYVIDTPNAPDFNVVVSPNVLKGLSTVAGNIAIRMSQHNIMLENNDAQFVTTVLAQGFPPVERYYTVQPVATVTIPREQLKRTMERIILLAKADKADAHGKFEFTSGAGLEIAFKATRGRIKKETVSTKHVGQDVSLNLSANLILDALKRIKTDNVDITFQTNKNTNDVVSCIVYPEGQRDYGVFNMGVVGN